MFAKLLGDFRNTMASNHQGQVYIPELQKQQEEMHYGKDRR